MEWLFAGAVGLVTGFVGPLVAPWAQHRASEAKTRQADRRTLVTNARALHSDYLAARMSQHAWMDDAAFLGDPRFLAVYRLLDDEVRTIFTKVPGEQRLLQFTDHEQFRDNVDRLEQRWKLS